MGRGAIAPRPTDNRSSGRLASSIFAAGAKALAVILALSLQPLWAVEDIRIVGLFKDKALVEIDGQQRLLRAGQTSTEGVRLISANAREAVLEMDGERGTYKLGSRISGKYAASRHRDSSVRIWPNRNGAYTVIGSINGFPVTFLVDTGATNIAMNAAQAKRLGIDYRVSGQPGMASTASGVVRIYNVTLDRVKVGDIELHDIEAGVIDGHHPTEVLLGMTFLGKLDMTRKGQMLELTKRR